jgi:hypothetical protein
MNGPYPERIPRTLQLYLQISEYPILAQSIRDRMREELFARGVINPDQFEREVREKAVLSQQREGLSDPLAEESAEVWAARLSLVRDHLTDFYFAYNLSYALFEEIVRAVLAERAPGQEVSLPFNPELAPSNVLVAQAREYTDLSPAEQKRVSHHLREITVVLVKSMISDQIGFVRLAKEFLDVDDFERIGDRRIGEGKIGGKAAGMILAGKILDRADPEDEVNLTGRIVVPESCFIGADVFYDFHSVNRFTEFVNQKYKSPEEIAADYPHIQETYAEGRFPDGVHARLKQLLVDMGGTPLIVRSSSLLEDNFGYSFAGKYESFFCPNQGTLEQNLRALMGAISLIYASVLSPDALVYRQKMGLVDYDERMAILIQRVQGRRWRDMLFPPLAGVGFSRNPFRWNRKIRPEDGLLRLVWGLGTRAVDRVANDYPRMVALSHPQLRPELEVRDIRRYSQHFVDLIDLRENSFRTRPVGEVLRADYPGVHMLASRDHGDYLQPLLTSGGFAREPLVLTFDQLLKNQDFVALMRAALRKLERHYECPVDIEFTVDLELGYPPQFTLNLLQCRPLSGPEWDQTLRIPRNVPTSDVVFRAGRLVPHGRAERVRYIVFVDPATYAAVPDYTTRYEIARVVGRVNKRLEGQEYVLMGPGRWGSSNVELGVKVTYADIHNARVLVEMAMAGDRSAPEASYGTHFYLDLVESRIYPLPLYSDDPGTALNREFLRTAPNALPDLLPQDASYSPYVKVIDVPAVAAGRYLEVVMIAEQEEALGYLRRYRRF